MFKLTPSVKLIILGIIFFLLFLNLITFTNFVASQRNVNDSLVKQIDSLTIQKKSLEEDVSKQSREEISVKNNQQSFVKINFSEILRPADVQIQKKPQDTDLPKPFGEELSIIGR